MRWLRETVTDANGKTSSKRVAFMGAFLVSSAVMLMAAWQGQFSAEMFNYYLIGFCAVGAAGVLEKKHGKD